MASQGFVDQSGESPCRQIDRAQRDRLALSSPLGCDPRRNSEKKRKKNFNVLEKSIFI